MAKKLSVTSSLRTGLYKTTTRLFFNPSKLFEAQITELFDEVWPTITALKTLRWQVRGYYEENCIESNERLSSKFVEKEDKTNRPNLYRICIEESWSDMEFRIAKNLLTNIFACYEGWAEQMVSSLEWDKRYAKELQFPLISPNDLISIKKIGGSNDLKTVFYDEYKSHSKLYNLSLINNWLWYYRYFKECRNSIIHNGGQTTQKVIDAYYHISTLNTDDVGVVELPIIIPTCLGQPLELSLRGVVGFSQIVLRLVTTFDIELIQCEKADSYFEKVIRSTAVHALPMNSFNHEKDTKKIIQSNYFRKPADTEAAYRLLVSHGIFR